MTSRFTMAVVEKLKSNGKATKAQFITLPNHFFPSNDFSAALQHAGGHSPDTHKWTPRHGTVFAPNTYELLHLSRSPRKFNMTVTITMNTKVIEPKLDMRVLGLQVKSTSS